MRLYIHIPFCTSKCGYCAFNSFVMEDEKIASYIEALCMDLEWSLRGVERVDSVFFGGGTPNLLPARYFEKIFDCLQAHTSFSPHCEVSLESNVNLIDKQWCKDLISFGANRLSVGVQSFCKQKLSFLEREHNGSEVAHRIESAYSAGFENLSCDLIIGTPLDSHSLIEFEILQATALPLSHISMYALSIDEGSRFALESKKGIKKVAFDGEDLSFYARDLLQEKGFMQYEVSNYARTHKCAHNLGYWRGEEYLGCGAGAVGRVGSIRIKGVPNLNEYIQYPTKRLQETLSYADLVMEGIMLGLRCEEGFNLEILGDRSRVDSIITPLLDGGKCTLISRVTPQGVKPFLVANELFLSDEIALYICSRMG